MQTHGHAAAPPAGASAWGMGRVVRQALRILLWLSFVGWLGGHVYSFIRTWSRYELQYSRKYMPYIKLNCGDSKFHHATLGLNHCDEFFEAISIPSWERALFEEIQKLPVCSDGKCDSVVSGITNNKTWLCGCMAIFTLCVAIMLRIKWRLENHIRSRLPLDHPATYIETINAPAYVDKEGRSIAYQFGIRRRINASAGGTGNAGADNMGILTDSAVTPCSRYGDVSL